MTTDQILDIVVKVNEPVTKLIGEIKQNQETTQSLKDDNRVRFVFALIKNHRERVYEILSKLDDVSVEEVKNRDIKINIQALTRLVELKDFF